MKEKLRPPLRRPLKHSMSLGTPEIVGLLEIRVHWLVTSKRAYKRTCKVACELFLRGKTLHPGTPQTHKNQGFFAIKNRGFTGTLTGSGAYPSLNMSSDILRHCRTSYDVFVSRKTFSALII